MTTTVYSLARDPQAAGDDTRSVATDTIISFAMALIGYPHVSYRELTKSDNPFPVIALSVSGMEMSHELSDRIAKELHARGIRIKNIGEYHSDLLR